MWQVIYFQRGGPDVLFLLLLLSASVVSDSVRPHRRQLTRLPHPWDSPGKNTGVGCHFLLQCMKVKSESEVTQSCLILRDPMDCSPPGSFIHGIIQARVLEWGAIAFSGIVLCISKHTTFVLKGRGWYATHKYTILLVLIWMVFLQLFSR